VNDRIAIGEGDKMYRKCLTDCFRFMQLWNSPGLCAVSIIGNACNQEFRLLDDNS